MDLTLVVRGVVLGLAISAPVGPIGVLCIRRTLAEGRVVGLVAGLGAATADALYGALVAFGLTAVTSLLVGGTFWLQLIGGLFLLYLGVQTMRARPAVLVWVNRTSGVLIIIAGLVALAGLSA